MIQNGLGGKGKTSVFCSAGSMILKDQIVDPEGHSGGCAVLSISKEKRHPTQAMLLKGLCP